jgi:hypothetical protein
MLAPTGRGALPETATTVAIANTPSRTHWAAGDRISRMVVTVIAARCEPVACA